MTTKKIIFAAALLAGTMTTSWAGSSEASVSVVAKRVLTAEVNSFNFDAITTGNCESTYASAASHTSGSHTVLAPFTFTVATNDGDARVTIDYNGKLQVTRGTNASSDVEYALYYTKDGSDTLIETAGSGTAVSAPKDLTYSTRLSPNPGYKYDLKARITTADLCGIDASIPSRTSEITINVGTV